MISDNNIKLIAYQCAGRILERFSIAHVKNSVDDGSYMNFATNEVIGYAVRQLSIKVSSKDSDTLLKIKNDPKFKQYLNEQLEIMYNSIVLYD